jgi:hypothetical protein
VIRLCGIAWLIGAGLLCAEPNEKGLWYVWDLHARQADDHKAVLAACIAFSRQNLEDPLVPVSNTLAAWHLLSLGKQDDAARLLARYAGLKGNAVDENAAEMARAWLSRMDRDQVREALQFYYRKEIKYPRTLKQLLEYPALPPGLKIPVRDRFDQPWKYKLVGFTRIPGLLDQKYALRSTKLGIDSDLEESMAWPYAARIRMVPVKMQPNGVQMNRGPVGIEGPQNTFLLGLGQKVEGVTLVYAGRNLLILSDRDHWKVLRYPWKVLRKP